MANGLVPVIRIRTTEGGTDQYGEPIPGAEERTPLVPALYAPGGTSEPTQSGATPVISSPSLYWRGHHPDITAADRLVVDGVQWRVEGKPAHWPKGTVVTLAAVTNPNTTRG